MEVDKQAAMEDKDTVKIPHPPTEADICIHCTHVGMVVSEQQSKDIHLALAAIPLCQEQVECGLLASPAGRSDVA